MRIRHGLNFNGFRRLFHQGLVALMELLVAVPLAGMAAFSRLFRWNKPMPVNTPSRLDDADDYSHPSQPGCPTVNYTHATPLEGLRPHPQPPRLKAWRGMQI